MVAGYQDSHGAVLQPRRKEADLLVRGNMKGQAQEESQHTPDTVWSWHFVFLVVEMSYPEWLWNIKTNG